MSQGRMCVGGHDLDNDFRSLRLFRHDNTYLQQDARLEVGEIWELDYTPRLVLRPPHIEDVIVAERPPARRAGRERHIAQLVLEQDQVWRSVEELFDGCLRFTAGGSAYVSAQGPRPSRSTGYWLVAASLSRFAYDDKPKYRWDADGPLCRMPYVGLAESAPTIPAGSLVRLSLSRPNAPPGQPSGCWLQLSGWYPAP